MPQVPRPVQDHPRNRKPDEQRDVNRLAESAARPLILNRIQQMQQLVLIHLAVSAGADAYRLALGRTVAVARNEAQGGVRRQFRRGLAAFWLWARLFRISR